MAQSRPKTTTDPLKAIARTITDVRRRVRDLELRPDPVSSGGGDTFLRVTWCGGNFAEADFDGTGTSHAKLLTFEDPSTVEQSGGFTFSDHPDAASIDWDLLAVVGPNHHLHRIQVPEDGLYTVIVNYCFDISFGDVDGVGGHDVTGYVEMRTQVEPDTVRNISWFLGAWAGAPTPDGGSMTSGRFTTAAFTVELFAAQPFWITAQPFWYDADGSDGGADLGQTLTKEASLTVEKST